MSRITPRTSSVGPTMGLILGGVIIFSVAFLSLYAVIRAYLDKDKAASAPRVEMALAGSTAGLAPPSPTIAKANSAAAQPLRRPPPQEASAAQSAPSPPPVAPEAPRGPWAAATPPTWLATVDPGAAFVAAPFAAPSSNFDLQPRPEDMALDVPLPRPRPRAAP